MKSQLYKWTGHPAETSGDMYSAEDYEDKSFDAYYQNYVERMIIKLNKSDNTGN